MRESTVPRLDRRKLLLAVVFFTIYAVGRTLLIIAWLDVPAAQIALSFLVLLPLLYSAFSFYEIGGIAAALATIALNLVLRRVFDQGSGLEPRILWSTWAAAIGIGGLVGYIVRINVQLRQRTRRLELLTREANHRIKNSLSLAVSVVGIEEEEENDPRVVRLLDTIGGRIGAIADLHDILAWDGTDGRVNLYDYVEALSKRIQRSVPLEIRVRSTTARDIRVNGDRATCLGVICNELLLNVAQHDRSDAETPAVTIELSADDSRLRMVIGSDRGTMPTESPEGDGSRRGMGTDLINAFVEELHAEFEIVNRSPPTFSIRFQADRP